MIPFLYRVLLRLYPRDFRTRFGAEMLATARSLDREPARRRLAAVKDACASVVAVRVEARRHQPVSKGQSPMTILSGGWADLRQAMRALRKVPMFTSTVVLTLGLGIGAYTVVYAIVDAFLIRPLPFGDRADRLITIHSTHPTQAQDWDDSELSYADLLDLRESAPSLTAVEGVLSRNFSVAATDDTARVLGASVTPGLFAMLGIEPALGRLFLPEEGAEPGFESVAILSHGLWQSLFDSNPDIVGRPILINARQLTVVGVMPERFQFPEVHQLWLPYAADRTSMRSGRTFLTVGLLAPDVAIGQAAADAGRVAQTLAARYPDTNRDWGMHVMPLREYYVGDGRGMKMMLAAVWLLLLVVCANVAGLLVARGVARERELVTRAAIGAGRVRLVRMLLVESVVLAAVGGGLGIAVAWWGLKAILATVAGPIDYWVLLRIDARVLLSAMAATSVVALVAGLVPAWRLSNVDVSAAGMATRTAGSSRGHRRFQRGLVVAQVAVTFTMLIGSTLLARSAIALQHADAGFDPAPIASGRFYMAGDAYDAIDARTAAVARVLDAVAALPGVTEAAVTGAIPADDGGPTIQLRPGGVSTDAADRLGVTTIWTSPGLWSTLGLRLLEGRTFTDAEWRDPDTASVIVNARLAARFWPGESPIARTMQVVNAKGDVTATLRVVGVAPNLVYEEFGETTTQSELNVYMPYAGSGSRTLALLVRAPGNPGALADGMRRAVRSVDPSFAAYDVLTMTDRRAMSTWGERFLATTFAVFAVTALLLACLGTYGVVAYAAAQRQREVGVRLALGAVRSDIVTLLVRSELLLGAVGVAIGIPLATLAAKALSHGGMLFDVSPWDARTWLALPIALFMAVIAAALQPALRASRADPAEALRE